MPRRLLATVMLSLLLVALPPVAGPITARAHEGDAAATPSASPVAGSPELLLRATIDQLPAAPVIVGLSRWTYLAGANYELMVPGPELYAVESGSLGLRVDGPATLIHGATDTTPGAPEAAVVGVDFTLRPGDIALVPADTAHMLRNDGDEPVVFLNTVIFPASLAIPSWLPDAEAPADTSVRNLIADALAVPAHLPTAPVEISVRHLTLAPQATLPAARAGSYELLRIELGELLIATNIGEQTYYAGEVASLRPGTARTARNAGADPVETLILTITPVGANG